MTLSQVGATTNADSHFAIPVFASEVLVVGGTGFDDRAHCLQARERFGKLPGSEGDHQSSIGGAFFRKIKAGSEASDTYSKRSSRA